MYLAAILSVMGLLISMVHVPLHAVKDMKETEHLHVMWIITMVPPVGMTLLHAPVSTLFYVLIIINDLSYKNVSNMQEIFLIFNIIYY